MVKRAPIVVVAALLVVIVVWALVSPRPGALVVRWYFERGNVEAAELLEQHVPAGVTGATGLAYGDRDDERLDIWYPSGIRGSLPVVVWVHGGGWVSGDKKYVAPYLKILAARGHAVVGVNYSLAPGADYPDPVQQVADALAWLEVDADRFPLDSTRVVLAGDSAGAHIAAQLALAATDREYAQEVGLELRFDPASIKGVALASAALDPAKFSTDGLIGWFVKATVRSYFGSASPDDEQVAQATVATHVTESYPPVWLASGPDDPLHPQSTAFAKRLDALGVDVRTEFPSKSTTVELGHEYQFNLDTDQGQAALESLTAFLFVVTGRQPD